MGSVLTKRCKEVTREDKVIEKASDRLWAMIHSETGLSTHCMDIAVILQNHPDVSVHGLHYLVDGLKVTAKYKGQDYTVTINPK